MTVTGSNSTIESRRMNVAPWVLLVSVAALLRIVLALHPGLWSDEVFSLAMATGHSLEHPANEANPALGDYVESRDPKPPSTFRRYAEHDASPAGPSRVIRAVQLSDTSPPLYYLLLNVWSRLLGTTDAALRLFSALWAIACFPLLWSIGLELEGRRTAWAGCVLFAFSPLALYYSTEGRMYSLVWFLAVVLAWSTLALVRRGPRAYILGAWALSAAAGLLTHYFFAFVLFACLLWLFLHPGKVARLHVAYLLAVTALSILPWYLQLPEIMKHWRVTGTWLAQPLTWTQAVVNPSKLAWSYFPVAGIWGGSRRANIVAAGLYGLVILFTLRQGASRLFRARPRLLWLWVLGAVLGPVVFDLAAHTSRSLVVRYALPGLPAAIMLVALGISNLPKRAYVAFLILIPFIWLPGVRKVFAEPARSWEPFPQLSARLNTWAKSQDLIIVHSIPSGVVGVARYMAADTPVVSWVVQLKQRRVPDDIQRLASAYQRVALVKVHDLNEPSAAEDWLLQNKVLQLREKLHASPDVTSEILYFGGEPR
jgi:Dolichyl-phosphate-mannose-protein mannosyltransferase